MALITQITGPGRRTRREVEKDEPFVIVRSREENYNLIEYYANVIRESEEREWEGVTEAACDYVLDTQPETTVIEDGTVGGRPARIRTIRKLYAVEVNKYLGMWKLIASMERTTVWPGLTSQGEEWPSAIQADLAILCSRWFKAN